MSCGAQRNNSLPAAVHEYSLGRDTSSQAPQVDKLTDVSKLKNGRCDLSHISTATRGQMNFVLDKTHFCITVFIVTRLIFVILCQFGAGGIEDQHH